MDARTTFLTIEEILERTQRYVEQALAALARRIREESRGERTRLFLDVVEEQRASLEAAIDRCRRGAPEQVLETRAQYSVDPWERAPIPPADLDIESAVQWLLAIDDRLVRTYHELAVRTGSEAVAAFLHGLVEVVQAQDRRLVKESQTARDV